MSNMHLVTGFAGREHVTASDHGSLYAALFGSGTYVLDKGKKFELTKISDNLIRVLDGDLLMQGRHCRIEDDAYVELTVENGTQGYLRRDLVVCRYTKDADSGVEGCDIVVLRGDPVGAEPADPAYITGDIIKDGALQNDVPLYRLNLNGLEITSVDSLLPSTIPPLSSIPGRIDGLAAALEGKFEGIGNVRIREGSFTGTGVVGNTNSITNAIPLVLEEISDFILIAPTNWIDGQYYSIVDPKILTGSFKESAWYHVDNAGNRKVLSYYKAALVGNTIYRSCSSLDAMFNEKKQYSVYYINFR